MSWPWPFKRKQSTDVFRYSVVLPYETIPANTMLYRAAPTVEEQPTPRECKDTFKVGVYFSMNHPYLAETMIAEKQFDMPIAMYKTTRAFRVVVGKYTIPGLRPELRTERCRASRDCEIHTDRSPKGYRVIRQMHGKNEVLNEDEIHPDLRPKVELQNEAHVDHEVLPFLDATVKPEAPFAELFLTAKELRHVKYLGCYFRTQQEVAQLWYS